MSESIRRTTVVDEALDAFRGAIRQRHLVPGDRIEQAVAAEDLGVSVVAVREALRVLAGEGLVEFRPHRGAIVRGFSARELNQIWQVRLLLEPPLAIDAAQNISPADAAAADAAIEKLARASANLSDYVTAHGQLHDRLFVPSTNRILADAAKRLRDQIDPYLREFLAEEQARIEAVDLHRELVDVFKHGTPSEFGAVTAAHISIIPEWADADSGGDL